ncbi:MAG: hypothetical protein C0485_04305 [Pirellula sp.]|nr:hypothetical protein [Pirellula sp.]
MMQTHVHGLPRWEPTAEQIAAETAKIRATWSPGERRRRCEWAAEAERVTVAEVHLDDDEGELA